MNNGTIKEYAILYYGPKQINNVYLSKRLHQSNQIMLGVSYHQQSAKPWFENH